jgi:hypothetical protein
MEDEIFVWVVFEVILWSLWRGDHGDGGGGDSDFAVEGERLVVCLWFKSEGTLVQVLLLGIGDLTQLC